MLPVVLHLGDYDPSGVHLFKALAEDVGAMIESLDGNVPLFYRLAVTPEQIGELALPSAPPKKTDRRAFDADYTVQCEAIPPDVLTDNRATTLAQKQQDRAKLMDWIGQ